MIEQLRHHGLIVMFLAMYCCVTTWICDGLVARAGQETSTSAVKRLAVPSDDEIKNGVAVVNAIFKDEFAKARRPKATNEKRDLAGTLYQKAADSQDDTSVKYVLLREALKLFQDIGDVRGGLQCVNKIGEWYEADVIAMKVKLFENIIPMLREGSTELIEQALSMAEAAQEVNEFDTAMQLFQIVQSHAAKFKDKELLKRVVDLKQDNQEQRSELEAYRAANATLAGAPDNPAANLTVGRYLCLVQGNWDAGHPKLLKAGAAYKSIAEQEKTNPTTLDAMLKLADAWWTLADAEKGLTRTRLQREAGYWYRMALPDLSGINKTAVEKKLKDVHGPSPRLTLQPGLVMVVYNGTEFEKQLYAGIDPVINTNYGGGGVRPGLPVDNFSVRWLGTVRVDESANYKLFFEFDDCGRLWVDDKLLIDGWKGGINHTQAQVALTKGYHAIKVEYAEHSSTAGINLSWQRETTKREIIPATALFHDAKLARKFGVK